MCLCRKKKKHFAFFVVFVVVVFFLQKGSCHISGSLWSNLQITLLVNIACKLVNIDIKQVLYTYT